MKDMVAGILAEISGPIGTGKTEYVLRHIAHLRAELNDKLGAGNSGVRVAWVEDQLTVYPCAFPSHGVSLDHVLFVEAGKDVLWATLQVIHSRIFKVIVVSSQQRFTEIQLRRLQLAAEQAQVEVVLLSERPTVGAWPISFQAEARRPLPATGAASALAGTPESAPTLRVLKKKRKVLEAVI